MSPIQPFSPTLNSEDPLSSGQSEGQLVGHSEGQSVGQLAGQSAGTLGSGKTAAIPFSLVIPAYNEAKRIATSIRDIRAFFSRFQMQFEVLVIVEKSSDRTIEIAREAAAGENRIVIIDNQVQRGKGYAVKSGMLRARGDLVFFMDADLSTPLSEVLAFLAHFSAHPEVDAIIGNRADAKSQILKKQSWLRRNMGRTFNKINLLFGIRGVKDTQCGFKAFRAPACREIFSRQTIDGFAFDVEILLLATKMGYRFDVLPVRWINSPDSKVRLFSDPIKMLWDLIRIRWIVRKTLRARPLSP